MTYWDFVLRGGRVVDPETGLDGMRDVAVAGGRVAAVAASLPSGALPSGAADLDLDVTGQVVTAASWCGTAAS